MREGNTHTFYQSNVRGLVKAHAKVFLSLGLGAIFISIILLGDCNEVSRIEKNNKQKVRIKTESEKIVENAMGSLYL